MNDTNNNHENGNGSGNGTQNPPVYLASLVMRVGLAFAFLYPAVRGLQDPSAWIGYIPPLVQDFVGDPSFFLFVFEIIEILLAVWILSGWKIRTSSTFATLILIAIVVGNATEMDILFRDLAIAALGMALLALHRPEAMV